MSNTKEYSSDRINPKTGELITQDYTGFAAWELTQAFSTHRPHDVGIEEIAKRADMGSGDLRRLVVKPDVNFVGLGMADRIFLKGLRKNVSHLIRAGELTIIPNYMEKHARWMAEDEFWALDKVPSMVDLMVRTGELIRLRREVLGA